MKTPTNHQSLSEVHSSVPTEAKKGFWKKFLAFLGPAYLVSVGYMDPGNWATDLAGGSKFGYSLLWVLLMSNLIALLLQSLSARLGIVRGRDLAQASRESYPRAINLYLYILAEIAIAACDMAEVLGMAIGLQLLFNIPLAAGVLISVLDTFLLLFLLNFGIRKMEAFIISLVALVGASFFMEMIFVKPDLSEISKGFMPSLPGPEALYIAIGIIGATVMPHNLYLHSALVQTRKIGEDEHKIKRAIRFNILDSAIALNLAFFVNAGILILAATAFYKNGFTQVAEIQDAHRLLEPVLGTKWAPILFAVALIAAGQSSTITGTLAGQIVMEGYLSLRIRPWIRRILTRVLAIVPSLVAIWYMGEAATGKLLILSQVILSMQLGFAIIPLIHFVSDRQKMKKFAISLKVKIAAWVSACIIVGLNVRLVIGEVSALWNDHPVLRWLTGGLVIPLCISSLAILLYITFQPFIKQRLLGNKGIHGEIQSLHLLPHKTYKRIAVAVDFSRSDIQAINHALKYGDQESEFLLMHVVETAGAMVMGKDITDHESEQDRQQLNNYQETLAGFGYRSSILLGYGNPVNELPKLTRENEADLLVMAAHGHRGLRDFILGTTLDRVRHEVNIPVLIISNQQS